MSSFLMYIDKMSVKSDDSSNCIYSASSSSQAANSGAVLDFTIFFIYFLFFFHWNNQSFRKESCAVVDPLLYMVSCGILETVRKIQHFYNSIWEGKKKKMFKIFISACSKLCSDFHTLYLLGNDF